MKNYFLLLTLSWLPVFLNAQNRALDTIYANDQKNVALFFPAPIRQGITGAENFVFTYNREKQQFFGLLQAKPGKESNLLVVNTDGAVFSYIIGYRKELKHLNYFISASSSIGNEKPKGNSISSEKNVTSEELNKERHYREFCEYLMRQKSVIHRLKEKKEGIELSIENIRFHGEEIYVVMNIYNHSSLDYDLNFLKLSIVDRKQGKRKSIQSLMRKPVYQYLRPSRVMAHSRAKLVYVFPKFSLGDHKMGILEMNERKGERNLKLKLNKRFINHPY